MTSLVLPYTNPDLDGVACALSLEVLAGGPWRAAVSGELDEESAAVLDLLGLAAPPAPPPWKDVEAIWLVDTHHPSQLPLDLPEQLVVAIVDHHSGGDP